MSAEDNMIIYVIEHMPTDDIFRTYDGMDEETVKALVSADGNPYDILEKDAFDAAAEKLTPWQADLPQLAPQEAPPT
jgi:hypothetical protein